MLRRPRTLSALLCCIPQSSHCLTERLAMPGHPPTQRHPKQDDVMATLAWQPGVSGSSRKRCQSRWIHSYCQTWVHVAKVAVLRAVLLISYFTMHCSQYIQHSGKSYPHTSTFMDSRTDKPTCHRTLYGFLFVALNKRMP